MVYALDATDHQFLEAIGEFDFDLDFLEQFMTDVQQNAAKFEQLWNDPGLLAAYPDSYPLFEPI